MRKIEAKANYIAGCVWNIWSSHWFEASGSTPPFHFLRIGGSEDLLFATTLTESELHSFLKSQSHHADFVFEAQGTWPVADVQWFGHWTTFSARIREGFAGLERKVWGGDEAFDFDDSGDPRLRPLL